jgi:exonuclease SbcC
LVPGDPCPVCEQPVAKVSKRKRPAALSGSERAVTAAEKIAKSAREHASQVGAERATVGARTEALMVQLDSLTIAVADHPDREVLAATLVRLDQSQTDHAEAREHDQLARRAEAAAADAEAKATHRAAGAARTLQSRREELLRAGLEPPERDGDIAVAWAELAKWAASTQVTLGQTAIDARTAADHARSARSALAASLIGQARELDVPTDAHPEWQQGGRLFLSAQPVHRYVREVVGKHLWGCRSMDTTRRQEGRRRRRRRGSLAFSWHRWRGLRASGPCSWSWRTRIGSIRRRRSCSNEW